MTTKVLPLVCTLVRFSAVAFAAESTWTKPTFKPPAEGMYLASGCYASVGRLAWAGGYAHTEWSPNWPVREKIPELMRRDNQGNTVQYWCGGEALVEEAKRASAAGMSLMTCCGGGSAEVAKRVRGISNWVCYDLHESFSFSFYEANAAAAKGPAADDVLRACTLKTAVDDFVGKVRGTTDRLHRDGWGLLTSSSASFHLDYLMLGGLDAPGLEFYPFADTQLGASLCRGMLRQFNAPAWHAYLAHDWYSYLPHTNPYKMDSLRTMLQLQYLNGVKILTLESGNQWSQSNLCVDSPQSHLPAIKAHQIGRWLSAEGAAKAVSPDELKEAKQKFSWIDYRSPVVTKYRAIVSDFWNFVKENPQPAGQPEAVVALAKGNHDLATGSAANVPIAYAYDLARVDHHWMCGEPERSWDLAKGVFWPKPPIMKPNRNMFYSGTPYGQLDVVSFADKKLSAEHLLRNYKAILFTGWNTCSEKQYKVLCDYVKGGGRLCLTIAHLSTNDRRNYDFFTKDELVNGGDFSDLCGIKVKKQGDRFYWATGPSPEKNCLGLVARRRYGIMGMPLGDVEFTGPKENYEFLAVDDESSRPMIVRAKSGKGEVFFVNVWSYPAEANRDDGTGCTEGSKGLMGELYAYVARISRGNAWITGPDFKTPDADCDYIVYSYFPDAGKIMMLNLDYDNERSFVLHWFGEKDFITLEPAEFRIMDAPKLDPEERLNAPFVNRPASR